MIVAVLAVVLVVLLFSKRTQHSETHLSSVAKPEIDIDSKVNQYMQDLQRKRTTEELRTLGRLQRNFDKSRPSASIDETDPSTVPIDRQIWKDESNEVGQSDNQMDVIYRRIYEEEVAKRMSEQEKKDYASEFIENARRSGYHIQLSMDLEVISVEPIRNPQGEYDSLDMKN